MFIKRFLRPFRQLQGKLTLSYTLTSVVTFLLAELLLMAVFLGFVGLNIPLFFVNGLNKEALQARPYFVHGSPDRAELTNWLRVMQADLPSVDSSGKSGPIFLAVLNMQGQAIASIGSRPLPLDSSLETQLSSQSAANLRAVLNDGKGMTSLVSQEADNTLVAEAPIMGSDGRMRGVLILKMEKPNILQLGTDILGLVMLTGIIVTIITAIAGTIFGYFIARGITRRLKRLSAVADRWGRGDFSTRTHDAAQDELGQMSRQLNCMAEQLQNLLQVQQKLATLEERNRLARNLHDSVKQQIFVVVMQIGATKLLLKRDVPAAEARLNEMEKLVLQAQQELTSLIRELRPVALEGKGFVVALRELATQWAQQTDIVANLRVEGKYALSLAVEEALFRIVQEALSNVARHSKATLVQMQLTTTDDTVSLMVSDNGQGFDMTRQWHLGVGLLSMQERMKALGGDAQVESTPGKGTRVVVRCPRLGVNAGGGNNVLAGANDGAALKNAEI